MTNTLTTAPTVRQVYGRTVPPCVWCERAKQLLDSKGLSYTFTDVSADPALVEGLKMLGIRTVPAIFIDGKWIGGYQELAELLK